MVKQVIKERRNHPRAKRILSIEYRLHKSKSALGEQEWHLSTTEDISAEGVSFYSDHEYLLGDILEIRVVMSGLLEIFKGKGEIVRLEQKRTGACFFIALRLADTKTKNSPSQHAAGRLKKSHSGTKRI